LAPDERRVVVWNTASKSTLVRILDAPDLAVFGCTDSQMHLHTTLDGDNLLDRVEHTLQGSGFPVTITGNTFSVEMPESARYRGNSFHVIDGRVEKSDHGSKLFVCVRMHSGVRIYNYFIIIVWLFMIFGIASSAPWWGVVWMMVPLFLIFGISRSIIGPSFAGCQLALRQIANALDSEAPA
jgi:hypothetical protein